MTRNHSRLFAALAAGAALLALPAALQAQIPVMEVRDNIVKINGVTTAGGVDAHIVSGATQDAILGMGVSPSFFDGNADALIFGYNGNTEQGSGFIGTRPTSGSGKITINIKNVREATFTSQGINLEPGNDYRVGGVALNVPDYVFEPDYPLLPIAELAAYVAANKHLPGIPSEAEIKAGDLGLGGFQMKLLEKVEELTLYTIGQEEKLAAVEELNTRLAADNARLEARLAALEQRLGTLER